MPRIAADDRLPVLTIRAGDLPQRVLVVGDPTRADGIASRLDDSVELGRSREYVAHRGRHAGTDIGVVSHGVGAAGAGVCFEELCRAGVERIVRAGTTGGLQPEVGDGDLVVATAAVRDEGFTARVVPAGFPAVASLRVTGDLIDAAGAARRPVHQGTVLTTDLFYPHPVLGSDLELWQRAGVVAVEMECAALFVVAAQHRVAAGAILAVDGNPLAEGDDDMSGYDPHRDVVREAVDAMIDVALTALVASASGR